MTVSLVEHSPEPSRLSLSAQVAQALFSRLLHDVKGRDDVIELVLIALFADGHVLLEDFPGSGKTTLAKALGDAIVDPREPHARGLIEPFRRIQFTPDLLPSDITGTTVFEPQTGAFSFRPGPLFAHVVLADEINRTSPKVQAAMLEAMAEKQVTVDNLTRPLDPLFFVIATQNPLDLAGTYPLPVPQLDRFLFKIRMSHIDRAAELEVLRTIRERRDPATRAHLRVTRDDVLNLRRTIDDDVYVHPVIEEALVDIARQIRDDRRVLEGVSTRSLVLMLPALKARALIRGRDYVGADDIETLAPFVFGHRIELASGTKDASDVIRAALRPSMETIAEYTLKTP